MELTIAIAIAATVAGFIYVDANQRDMNGLGWAAGVFLFLIVALPLYLIVRKPRKTEELT
jgi:4-amino-4-deoxy-L-arabinose transferase-like glycosyltransferase